MNVEYTISQMLGNEMKKTKDGEGIKKCWEGVHFLNAYSGKVSLRRHWSNFLKDQGACPADKCLGEEHSGRGSSKSQTPQTEISLFRGCAAVDIEKRKTEVKGEARGRSQSQALRQREKQSL